MKFQNTFRAQILMFTILLVNFFFSISCEGKTENEEVKKRQYKKQTYKHLELKDRIQQPEDSILVPGAMGVETYKWWTTKKNTPLLKVYKPNGVEIRTEHAVSKSGEKWISLDYSEISPGAYRLEFTDKNGLIDSYYGVITERKIGDEMHNYPCSSNFLEGWDFNGDHMIDHIGFEYTHGAHCCYKINLLLGGRSDTTYFPFEMDGHYECGVDESQPEEFYIKDYDSDGLPEIMMMIQTYNETFYDIPEAWQKKYGISENYILIGYENGKWHVEDYKNKEAKDQ